MLAIHLSVVSGARLPGFADQALEPRETTDRGEVGIFGGCCRIRALGQGALEEVERLAEMVAVPVLSKARATTQAAA